MATTGRPMKGLSFHHVALRTRDFAASLVFYTEVLGMREVSRFGTKEVPIALLDVGDGTHFELFGPVPDSPPTTRDEAPLRHVALAVDDVVAAIEHVRGVGCPVTVEPKRVRIGECWATIAFFVGPGGETIEFFHPDSTNSELD